MNPLIIPPTNNTPEFHLDGSKGSFKISGKSYPYDANEVYEPVLSYLKSYSQTPQTNTLFEFEWQYYNTSSSKLIVQMLLLLRNSNTDLSVIWKCKKGSDMLIQKAKEIRDLLKINMDIQLTD